MARSKEELEEIKRYKDYPEDSVYREVYDSVFLVFSEYLQKYYKAPDLSIWNTWQKKYLEPAYDNDRHEEMIRNFGYVSLEMYDFDTQYKVYNQLQQDNRLDNETRMFIGFLSGSGFFKRYGITVQEWFNMKNWNHPQHTNDYSRTISEILDCKYGINMLKSSLPQLPFWKR